jgi:hypothetical protein
MVQVLQNDQIVLIKKPLICRTTSDVLANPTQLMIIVAHLPRQRLYQDMKL